MQIALNQNKLFKKFELKILTSSQVGKKIKFSIYSFQYRLGVASWRSPLPELPPKYTVQGCIGGELMVTCVNLIGERFEPSLPP